MHHQGLLYNIQFWKEGIFSLKKALCDLEIKIWNAHLLCFLIIYQGDEREDCLLVVMVLIFRAFGKSEPST